MPEETLDPIQQQVQDSLDELSFKDQESLRNILQRENE